MKVTIKKSAQKQIDKLPDYLQNKLQFWIEQVESKGLSETRKNAGWHDELLHGDRSGERSIRLNKGYRAVYKELTGEIVEIQEVGNELYRH